MNGPQVIGFGIGIILGVLGYQLLRYLHWRKHRNDEPRWSNVQWINKPPGYD